MSVTIDADIVLEILDYANPSTQATFLPGDIVEFDTSIVNFVSGNNDYEINITTYQIDNHYVFTIDGSAAREAGASTAQISGHAALEIQQFQNAKLDDFNSNGGETPSFLITGQPGADASAASLASASIGINGFAVGGPVGVTYTDLNQVQTIIVEQGGDLVRGGEVFSIIEDTIPFYTPEVLDVDIEAGRINQ